MFSTDASIKKMGTLNRGDELLPAWSAPIGEMRELKKLGSSGWKAKLIARWSLDKIVQDGLEILHRKWNKWTIMACPLRDELFNRLCAIREQKQEA